MRTIDADALKYKNLAEVNGRLTYVLTPEEINNASTVKNEYMRGYEAAEREYKRPQGEWKLHGMIYYCSECGHECGESGDNYCGNCGADMRKGGAE